MLIFQKRYSSRGIFSRSFQIFWQKFFQRAVPGGCWFLAKQTKTFSKLAIKQPIFWCLYYNIWTLPRIARSLMESFFVKFQIFPTIRILLTTVLLWKNCAILLEKFPRFHGKVGCTFSKTSCLSSKQHIGSRFMSASCCSVQNTLLHSLRIKSLISVKFYEWLLRINFTNHTEVLSFI